MSTGVIYINKKIGIELLIGSVLAYFEGMRYVAHSTSRDAFTFIAPFWAFPLATVTGVWDCVFASKFFFNCTSELISMHHHNNEQIRKSPTSEVEYRVLGDFSTSKWDLSF